MAPCEWENPITILAHFRIISMPFHVTIKRTILNLLPVNKNIQTFCSMPFAFSVFAMQCDGIFEYAKTRNNVYNKHMILTIVQIYISHCIVKTLMPMTYLSLYRLVGS